MDWTELKKADMNPHETQKAIYDFFIKKGFTYHRHLGFIYDRELSQEEQSKLAVELNDNGWFNCFNTYPIGELYYITSFFREATDECEADDQTK